jgi:RimJ/RimL family protein N-acetyltransferase
MFAIRLARPDDAAQLQKFYSRLGSPYRPEDAVEVEAMRARALVAQRANERWSPMAVDEPNVGETAHLAFWIASTGTGPPVGCVGVRRVGDAGTAASDTAEQSGLAVTGTWARDGDVGEVRRLRVAPEWRRRGLGTALMQELIRWSVDTQRLRTLVLNTTAAQLPALALYARLGFHELGRSYLGSYELVWMGLTLVR